MIQEQRVQPLNDAARREGRYGLYWMQASQRVRFNHALEYAVEAANDRSLPLLVCFGLMDGYPEANERHYAFMLRGLKDVAETLATRRIGFVMRHGRPDEVALKLAGEAAFLVCDRGYLRHQKAWRERVARDAPCPVVQVETDVVAPVEMVSDKHESAARTIRPRLRRLVDDYLQPLEPRAVKKDGRKLDAGGDFDPADPAATLKRLKLDRSVAAVTRIAGGEAAAQDALDAFLDDRFDGYADGRNEPSAWQSSFMSPYLHFGQVSPVDLALRVRGAAEQGNGDRSAYLEELIVRRELSMNFVHFEPRYDRYDCLPNWARKTLAEHRGDKRDPAYERRQLEAADTHDPYWNASMREMAATGFMHNYMRMYWGKKILEWTRTPEEAFETTLALNNKYFICGRDPNSYANVAWIFGLHDRAWTERPVFGKVRYMNAKGLERKFDIDAYVAGVERLADAERGRRKEGE